MQACVVLYHLQLATTTNGPSSSEHYQLVAPPAAASIHRRLAILRHEGWLQCHPLTFYLICSTKLVGNCNKF